MEAGKIMVAQHHGAYMIKLTGDVRVTWCAAFDEYLKAMLSDDLFQSILVDLSDADGIDSTTLGMLAKLSIQAQQKFDYLPTIFSPDGELDKYEDSLIRKVAELIYVPHSVFIQTKLQAEKSYRQ